VLKAILLAAGNGTRLRPLTNGTPKCLLPIQGTPLLQVWLESCKAAGIGEVLINAHAHAAQVHKFVEDWNGGIKLQIAEERELLGSAGTLAENRGFVADEKEFFVLYGDVLTNLDLRSMLEFHRRRDVIASLAVHRVADPKRCGIVGVDEQGMVQSFVEKPEHPESNLAFSGVMVASPNLLEFVPAERPADIGFHLLPKLLGKMAACEIDAYLLDIGTLEAYETAQKTWPGLRGVART